MELDVRLPMGAMFVLLGAILAVHGLFASPEDYKKALGVNVNLWWGLVIFAFGAFLLLLTWRGARKRRQGQPQASPAGTRDLH